MRRRDILAFFAGAAVPWPLVTIAQQSERLRVIGVLILKFAAKLELVIVPLLKFVPVILKTGGTMLLSLGVLRFCI